MRYSTLAHVFMATTLAHAKEMAKDEARAAEFYDNGLTHRQNIRRKLDFWKAEEASGRLDSSQW
jgi:ABC-type uncharacterized transport system YnjBCD substrate-binding protein